MVKTIGEWGQSPAEFMAWYDHALSATVVMSTIARTCALDHLGDEPRTAAELAADGGWILRSSVGCSAISPPRECSTAAVLPEALKAGKLAQHVAHNMSYFEMIGGNPALAEAFARFMTATTNLAEQFVLANHRFEPFDLAVDVGGNHGSLLLQLLAGQPGARVDAVGGSFFESVPAGGVCGEWLPARPGDTGPELSLRHRSGAGLVGEALVQQ